ncbi:hypothetical protein TcasGA2_TC034800 [Tribolium castaneum]|uniref:Uncharacterized protein n=1 Tax=Tribolium castaneum TaxID=7070 RepID=A0A139WEJ7_TRICA|nr:hypothetical protein TcasGA2_TC034800 [Tribolium castaneum]
MAKNPIYFIFWFVPFCFSFIIALLSALGYVFLYPLALCVNLCVEFTDLLLKGIQLPHTFAKKMIHCERISGGYDPVK